MSDYQTILDLLNKNKGNLDDYIKKNKFDSDEEYMELLKNLHFDSLEVGKYVNFTKPNNENQSDVVKYFKVWPNLPSDFFPGSIIIDLSIISRNQINQINFNQTSYHVTTLNLSDRYKSEEVARVRVFVEAKNREVTYVKKPFEKKSQVYSNMHYRVRDFITGDIIIPFNKSDNSNKLSSDSQGMYFDFYMDSLPQGRAFVFDFLIVVDGFDNVITDAASKFIVE